jgi:hypothetical protein
MASHASAAYRATRHEVETCIEMTSDTHCQTVDYGSPFSLPPLREVSSRSLSLRN